MDHPVHSAPGPILTRRDMLSRCGMGLGLVGLLSTLEGGGFVLGGTAAENPLAPKAPHFAPRATRLVHLFANGGASHVDTFDPKPLLDKHHGQPLPTPNLRTERKTGAAMRSPFAFRPYGQSGIEVSELFAKTAAACIDQMCIIRSMHADVPNHEPSLMLMNCGDGRLPRPSMGSWISYGLGTENQNLPSFIVLCPGGMPIVGKQNWRSAFLPGVHQGTHVDTKHEKLDQLIADIANRNLPRHAQRRQLDLLRALNQRHAQQRPHEADLEARIESFELAFRMQTEAAEAFDLSREPAHVRAAYGEGIHGRQLLLVRRLLERGVRVVQVWSGGGQPWDNHADLEANHRKLAAEWDGPIAAFLTDLKARGLLDDTLVMWGGEFGRTPVAELPQLSGRDHNHYGFSMWLAGGGVRGGHVHGATDEFGFAAVENKVHVHDLHATLLHLLGFDHTRLTYRYAGRDFRLTDVHGRVVHELIA